MIDLLARMNVGVPIIQAPMAGVSSPEMASAVTEAGALGSIALGATDVGTARDMIDAVRARTRGPFNVNVFCHRPAVQERETERAWLDALAPVFRRFGVRPPAMIGEMYTSFADNSAMQNLLLAARPAVVSFHFGLPDSGAIAKLKAAGCLLLSSATNLYEAQMAEAAGVDAIVAQGYEAGGHRGMFDPRAPDLRLGVLALTRLLVARISLPVIAAGGIMDGAGIAAALTAGAVAAQLGTAFVACPELCADAAYRSALFGPGSASTIMTKVFSGRPARGLPNAMTALRDGVLSGLAVPDYPIAYQANKALAAAARAKDVHGFGAQWAGQGAPLARVMPTGDLVTVLRAEISAALN